MLKEPQENRFYKSAMSGLIETTEQRKELESNFDRSKRTQYDEVCEKQLKYAVELLKMGTDCDRKEEKIEILLDDGNIVEFEEKEIREKAGDSAFFMIFPPEDGEAAEQTDDDLLEEDEFSDDITDREHSSTQNPQPQDFRNSYPAIPYANPFFSMMFPWMTQYMQPIMPRENALSEADVDALQAVKQQMEDLKASRNRIRESARYYRDKYHEAEKNFEEALKENEELDATATANYREAMDKNKELVRQIEVLEQSINEKEGEIEALEITVNELKSQQETSGQGIEEYKKAVEERVTQLKNESDLSRMHLRKLQEQLQEAQTVMESKEAELESLQKQLTESEAKMEQLKSELAEEKEKSSMVVRKDEQISVLKEDAEKAKTLQSMAESKVSELTRKVGELEKNNASLNKKSEEAAAKCEELKKQAEAAANNQDGNKKRINDLQNENSKLKDKNKDLEKKKNEIENEEKRAKERIEQLKKENDDLQGEILILKQVAYYDPKFGVGSLPGFNARFLNKENQIAQVILVDVCDMRAINERFEESIGDNVIQFAIDALSEVFGKGNVYRTRGAQFAVVVENGKIGETKGIMEEIRTSLNRDKEFDIVYGVVSIEKCPSRKEALERARKEMNEMMRKVKAANTQAPYQSPQGQFTVVPPQAGASPQQQAPVQNAAPTTPIQQAPQGQGLEPIQVAPVKEAAPANPNISTAMLDDPYSGTDEAVQEVDATSIDLAAQLMQMMS